MNDLLPYELELNQQWIDLPLPDENMAWADMKRRLDEEDKRRVIPFWLSGCAGWGLLAVLLLGLAWWILRPEKWFTNKHTPGTEKTGTHIENGNKTSINTDTSFNYTDTGITQAYNNDSNLQVPANDSSKQGTGIISPDKKKKDGILGIDTIIISTEQKAPVKKKKQVQKNDPVVQDVKKKMKDPSITIDEKTKKQDPPADTAKTIVETVQTKIDTVVSIVKTRPVVDTVQKKDTATKKPVDPVAQDKKPKKDSSKKNPMVFSAGIGIHQQLPVGGQHWSPYSSSGRKTSLADYIPSVYLRATKPGKWFFQSEFRYGAPQQVKEHAFRQAVTTDTNLQGTRFINTNTYTLRKTFYHQVPLSFNYYILPNWSLGAGMQWNNFYSAIAESEIIRHNNTTQLDSSLGKIIHTLKKDSAYEFRKSYWMGIVQTQYQWKRFTFGARYNFGLQPYINFTLPGGTPQEEKNNSLQVFILFELWRSKGKDKN